jgi:hypothetical protein
MSNFYGHPGKAGGSTNGIAVQAIALHIDSKCITALLQAWVGR